MTPLYHQAFPTGHSRFLTLTPVEIMLYVGLPGLYPLPVLWRMALTLSNPNPNPHPNPNPYACFLRDNQKEFRQAGRCVGTAQYSCTTYPKHVLNVYIQKSTSEIWPKIPLSEAIHLAPTQVTDKF